MAYLINPALWAPVNYGLTGTGAYWAGIDFYTSTAGVTISSLGWWRGDTAATVPTGLRLADLTTNTDVASVTVPDSASVGWKWANLGTPVPLVVGRMYRIGVTTTGNFSNQRAPRQTADAPLIYEVSQFGASWPTSQSALADMQPVNVSTVLVSGGTGPQPPPTEGTGDPTLTGDLQSWLSRSSTLNTHQTDGLPWHIGSVVDQLLALVNNLHGLIGEFADTASATGTLFARTAELLARVPAMVIQDIHDSFAQFFSWFGSVAKPAGVATIPDHLDAVDAQLESLAGQVAQLAGNVEQLQAPLAGFPTDFTLTDSFTFADCLAWNVAADVYVLHVTTVPHGLAISDMCGVPMIHRCGWWCTLNDTLPGERHYIDFEFTLLSHAAGRMGGVLLELGNEGAGTIEAYDRLPPPIGP